jgi:hypothetical protein
VSRATTARGSGRWFKAPRILGEYSRYLGVKAFESQGTHPVSQDQRANALRPEPAQALVSVVVDDESVRESLPELLKELGFAGVAA